MRKADMHGESEHESKPWGHGKFANMPTDIHMDMYPKAHEFGPGMEDDTMTRVDSENKRAHSKTHSHLSNQH
jgi:hypothetical protein